MARVLLIMPPLAERLMMPYIGQLYLGAALQAQGHEIDLLDLSDLDTHGATTAARARLETTPADIVGITLFTLGVPQAYALAAAIRHHANLLIAGGPHATILPQEPLAYGFDLVVEGEGEHVLTRIAEALEEGTAIPAMPGLHRPGDTPAARAWIEDLDALPFPLEVWDQASWELYPHGAWHGGIVISSRGCPARCSFCANHVTGRVYRWRSADNVVAEIKAWMRLTGATHIMFFDDAFTARRGRLEDLCRKIIDDPELDELTWTCITPANMVKPFDLALMRRAGCSAVNFGIESGDSGILRSIRKGQRPEDVLNAVRAAKAAGMMTTVNIMVGFPDEDEAAIDRTMALMEALAPDTDSFNNRGVLIPMPGTPIYEANCKRYGFDQWWLNPDRQPRGYQFDTISAEDALVALEHDPTLDMNYFGYSDSLRARIADCVAFKARHNRAKLIRTSNPS